MILAAGVSGGSVPARTPSPDRQDAFRASWSDGAKVLRVQTMTKEKHDDEH